MKILNLSFIQRRCLNWKNALNFDTDLNEKLMGLTHEESDFFVEMSEAAFGSLELRHADELKRFLELYERHERALDFQRKAHRF